MSQAQTPPLMVTSFAWEAAYHPKRPTVDGFQVTLQFWLPASSETPAGGKMTMEVWLPDVPDLPPSPTIEWLRDILRRAVG